MEAFSLLRYWRGGGTVGSSSSSSSSTADNAENNLRILTGGSIPDVTANISDATREEMETDGNEGNGDDDGPYFDLEFSLPDDDGENGSKDGCSSEDSEEEQETVWEGDDDGNDDNDGSDCSDVDEEDEEFNFTFSSGSSNDCTEPKLTLSPSDDLFFKGRFVPVDLSVVDSNGLIPERNISSKPIQFPVSLVKSATKFRVLMLRLKRSKLSQTRSQKLEAVDESVPDEANEQEEETKQEIDDFFAGENGYCKSEEKQRNIAELVSEVTEEKRFSKDVMQRYLKKVKPLYVRVSKKYDEKKIRSSSQFNIPSTLVQTADKPTAEAEAEETPTKSQRHGSMPSSLRVVYKHLGKSRSASSTVASATAAAVTTPGLSNRRDDSLIEQQDGIQSAIMHCKRSFNSSRDSEYQDR